MLILHLLKKNLIINHQRRLQKLKEQAALRGYNVGPEILLEIEDIEATIQGLQTELKALEARKPDKEIPYGQPEPLATVKPKQLVDSTESIVTSKPPGAPQETITVTQSAGDHAIQIGKVEGDFNIGEKLPTVEELIQAAQEMLKLSNYDETIKACQKIFESHHQPHHPKANLLTGIALLRGAGADRLKEETLKRVEAHLGHAANHPSTSATAWAVWGIIKYDYDVIHNRSKVRPTLKQT